MVKIDRTFPAPPSLAIEAKKASGKYDEGIIDCCSENPELLMDFRLIEGEVAVTPKEGTSERTALTATLIWEVFNLNNTGMRIYTSKVRLQELTKEMNKLYDALEELDRTPDSKVTLRKLKAILRRESAFAAFKRNYIRDNIARFPQLITYIV